ncbi:MAG TPA: MFS transporter [Solirubrobacterales bacterium]|jgi:MFS family permease
MRRLLLLGSAVVFLDVAFYTAITPLLPMYADDLGLSKGGAGVLTASYAAGTLIAALPSGFVAARVGPRRALLSGLLLLGLASLTFGFSHHVLLLDIARFVQGVGGALAWAGALTWLILSSPARRGSVIGDILGVAVAGSLLGPAIGALAESVGTELVFSSVLIVTVGLGMLALRIPEPLNTERQKLSEVREAMFSAPVVRATWYVAAPSAMFGVVEVLVPLRMDALGGGAGLVAAAFTAGAAVEAMLAPAVGRLSDRIGRLRPYAVGMLVCVPPVVLLPVAEALGVVFAVLIAISVGAGLCFTPALAMLSDAAEDTRLHQGFATGLINVAWASGQVVGGIVGGAAASAAGDTLPCLVAAALLLGTVAAARPMGLGGRRRVRPGGAP